MSQFRGKRLFGGRLFAGRLWGPPDSRQPPSVMPARRPMRGKPKRRDNDDDVLMFLLR